MKKLFITGASGFLGWNVCRQAQGSWDVFGTYLTHETAIGNVKMLRLDCTREDLLQLVFKDIRPDAMIHCAAYSDPNVCETSPSESYRINVQVALSVASLCAKERIPCVFTSTDLVFDGSAPPYGEDSPTCPVNSYGKHKAAAEKAMRMAYPGVTVCRMPLMFGDAGPASKSFLAPMIAALVENREQKLFTDEICTPVSGATAAAGLLLAVRKAPGVLHLGGRQSISRYDFGLLLAKLLDRSPSSIKPVLQKDVVMTAPRPRDVSLTSEKAFSLGYNPLPLEDQLQELECVKKAKKS